MLAFMDAYPVNPGHVLIIPKDHACCLADLNPDTGGEIFKAAIKIASAVRRSGVKCEGVNLILADGQAAGQEIFHVHLHVIPRYRNDNFSMSSKARSVPPRQELSSLAADISASLP